MDYKSLTQPTWCHKKWHINTKKISNKCAIFKKSKSSCDKWATRGGGGWRRAEGDMQMDRHDKSECWMKTYSININSDLIPVACSGWRSFRYDNIPELHFTSHLHHHGELHTLYSACLICDGHVHTAHTHTLLHLLHLLQLLHLLHSVCRPADKRSSLQPLLSISCRNHVSSRRGFMALN